MAIPHFAIPFRIDGARGARVNEQDSEHEIMACVETILRYEQGHRPEKEEFGIPDLTFSEPPPHHPDERLIQEALNTWEPRIEMHAHDPIIDRVDQLVFRLRVEAHQSE